MYITDYICVYMKSGRRRISCQEYNGGKTIEYEIKDGILIVHTLIYDTYYPFTSFDKFITKRLGAI